MAAADILYFQVMFQVIFRFDHSSVSTVWYLSFVPELVQLSAVVTEIETLMLKTFI